MPSSPGALRIGEFARRVGVSADLLRAWERRYGLLSPIRSSGGYRLYTDDDAERVMRMRGGLAEGLSAAQAAEAALAGPDLRNPQGRPGSSVAQLMQAIRDFDEPAMHLILDESLAAYSFEWVVRDLLLPTLRQVGDEWARGALLISQEHFASGVIRGRLLSLARLWSRGAGPLALLACVSGEAHDLSLLMFGLVLRSHGWRILFLGADTPVRTILETAQTTGPAALVIACFDPALVDGQGPSLHRLAGALPVFLCGPGADPDACRQLGVRHLPGDLIHAAEAVTSGGNGETAGPATAAAG